MTSWYDPENRETRMPTSTFGGPMPTVHEGQLLLEGGMLRRPSIHERPYACCSEALVLTEKRCVCFFESTCPTHGHRHNGTHD